jgi:hypothetical protein
MCLAEARPLAVVCPQWEQYVIGTRMEVVVLESAAGQVCAAVQACAAAQV